MTVEIGMPVYRPSSYGNQTARLGDKVKISCYNERSLGSYRTVHLQYNGNTIATCNNKSGSSASTSFIYDGSQAGTYQCKVYFNDGDRDWWEDKGYVVVSTG